MGELQRHIENPIFFCQSIAASTIRFSFLSVGNVFWYFKIICSYCYSIETFFLTVSQYLRITSVLNPRRGYSPILLSLLVKGNGVKGKGNGLLQFCHCQI